MAGYKVRVVNCDFWRIDGEEIIYKSLKEAKEDIQDFLDTCEAEGLEYSMSDIEIVGVFKVASIFKAGKRWCVYLHNPDGTLPSIANWTGFLTKQDAKTKCKALGYKLWNCK